MGFTSTEGHDFEDSFGLEDGKFMGLALDNDNDAGLTDDRITAWVKQLKGEFGL